MKQEDENTENELRAKVLQYAERQKRLLAIEAQVMKLKVDIDKHVSRFAEKVDEIQNTETDDFVK